ncbi:MAG: DUF817 domain-containing protein [Exiguobacterium oxidotolerans]
MRFVRHLIRFTYLEALCCVFPVAIFAALALSRYLPSEPIARYDILLLWCLFVQVALLVTRYETKEEFKLILIFHVIGLGLELFKVQVGSWSYPEDAFSKVLGVPLYAGFMYASVASYVCQAFRRLDLRFTSFPRPTLALAVGSLIYLNFFTHHWMLDLRWFLMGLVIVVFFKSWVYFRLEDTVYRLPLVLSFLLIAWFIWLAENIVTFFKGWVYPHQQEGWELVDFGKLSSWFLLVIITVLIVVVEKYRSGDSAVEVKS